MDLQKLRNFGWSSVWRRIATEQLKIFGAVQLADQVYLKIPSFLSMKTCIRTLLMR
jgi:hypothetical protein